MEVSLMVDALVTYLHANYQYNLHKKTRGLGLLGAAFIVLVLVKWDLWFYPIFDSMGLITIAEKSGLIQQTSVGTMFVIGLLLLITIFFTTLILFANTICSTILLALPMPIKMLLLFIVFIITSPFLLFKKLFTPANKSGADTVNESIEEDTIEMDKYKQGKSFLMSIRNPAGTASLTKKEVYKRLNQAVADHTDTKHYVLAYQPSNGGNWYILGSNPLPAYMSDSVSYNGEYSLETINQKLKVVQAATLYIPAEPVHFIWNKQNEQFDVKLYVSVNRSNHVSGLKKLDEFTEYYMLDVPCFSKLLVQQPSVYKNMYQYLNKVHEVAYLIPLYFQQEREKLKMQQDNYISQICRKANYKEYSVLYLPAVKQKLIKSIRSGDQLAYQALKILSNN